MYTYKTELKKRFELSEEGGHLKIVQTYSYNVLLSHVRAGLGVTILDAFAVQDVQGIMIHNLAEELPLRRYSLIRRTDRFCPPQTKAFLETLLQSPPPRYCTAL